MCNDCIEISGAAQHPRRIFTRRAVLPTSVCAHAPGLHLICLTRVESYTAGVCVLDCVSITGTRACPYRLSVLYSIHCVFSRARCTVLVLVSPHLRICTESVPVEVLRIFGCCVQHLFRICGQKASFLLPTGTTPPSLPCTSSHYLLSFTSTPLPVANVTWSRRFSRPAVGSG